jgi:hypothetical protein
MTTDANGCWIGPSSAFETRLLQPFTTYAMEQLRQRFLFTLTTTHDGVRSARALMQMAFETEVSTILVKMIDVPADLATTKVCERRHYIDVDNDMRLQRYLIGPSLDDLLQTPNMPEPYVDFLIKYLGSDYPRYRISALSVMVCIAKALQP